MNTNLNKIQQLIQTAEQENIDLAFELAKSQQQSLDQFWQPWDELLHFFSKSRTKADLIEVLNCHTLELHHEQNLQIPASIKYLKDLYTFDLYCSPLLDGTIPEELCEHPKISHFYVVECGLKKLPQQLAKLKDLMVLHLSDNEITHLQDYFEAFNDLMELEIDNNPLKNIPESIFELSKLKILGIGALNLHHIPDKIGQLTSLTALGLSNNQLNALPDAMANLKKLVILNLSDNQLDHFPEVLTELPDLKRLILYNNPIAEKLKQSFKQRLPNCHIGFKRNE